MPKSNDRCIFCGAAPPLTQEHIIPKALHKLVPATAGRYKTLYAIQHHTHSEYKARSRPGDPRDWKVRCVCSKSCNNGWMRELETRCRPFVIRMMKGEGIRVTVEEQTAIAAWAAMKSIVAEYYRPELASTHHMQRKRLMDKLLPPNSWGIWLGFVPRTAPWTPFWNHVPYHFMSGSKLQAKLARGGTDAATHYNAKIWTQIVGQLLIHIIHMPQPGFAGRIRFPTFPGGGNLLRIWSPTGQTIIWPPAGLYADDVKLVTEAFRDYLVSNISPERRGGE